MRKLLLLVFSLLFAVMNMWAADWYVATTGSDITGDGSSGNPWKTIGFAVGHASVLDGDVIYINEGTYTESIAVNKSLTFIGSGPSSNPTTIITHATSNIINLNTTNKSFTFQNLIIEGNLTNLGISAGSTIDINSFSMQDVIARNCKVAVYFSENYPGDDPLSAIVNSFSLTNVTITNNTHIGAYIGKAVISGTVSGCTVTNNGYSDADAAGWQKCGIQFIDFYGNPVPQVTVTNSLFDNNGNGASSIERTGLVYYTAANTSIAPTNLMTVSGCTFTDHPGQAVRIRNGYNVGNLASVDGTFSDNYLDIWFSNVAGTSSSTTLIRYTTDGTRTVGPGPTYSYSTIQAAVNAANPGDLILVADGTYNENVTINKNISLKSVNGEAVTIIDGLNSGSELGTLFLTTGRDGVNIGATGQGFTIKGIDGTPGLEKAAIYLQGTQSNISIVDNIIVARGDAGLTAEYNAVNNNITISYNDFTGKTFIGDNPAGVGFTAQTTLPNVPRQLVVMGGSTGTTNTQNITFTNNTLSGIAGGMSITDNSGNPISPTPQGNTMVTLDLVGTNTITGNVFSGTTTSYAEALRTRGAGTYTITGNNFNGSYPVNMTATTSTPSVGINRIAAAWTTNTFSKGVVVKDAGNNVKINSIETFIQAGIGLAAATDIVEVGAGTYVEQLHITIDNLTIKGAGKASTTIKSPQTLTLSFDNGSVHKPIVFINEANNCTISDLTVDGDGKGNLNYRFQGIGFWNAGGNISNVDVINIEDTPFSGAQHGVAIYSNKNTSSSYSISCSNMTIDDFQKNGITLNGSGLTVDLDNITIIGKGSITTTAQNGIQIGEGVTGTLDNSSITGIHWIDDVTPPEWTATALLLYGEMSMSNITLTQCQTNIYFIDTDGSISNSSVSSPVAYAYADAIDVYSSTTANNLMGKTRINPSPYESVGSTGNNGSRSGGMDITVQNCSFTGVNHPENGAIWSYAEVGAVNLAVNNCKFNNWYYGVICYNYGTGVHSAVVSNNDLSGNEIGFYHNGTNSLTATCNWWGTAAFGQIQQEVSGPVTYIPYLTNGTDSSTDPGFQPYEDACDDGFPVQNVTTGVGHANINSALAAAGAGQKIHISSGNYNENLTSPGNLTYDFGGSPGCVTITGDLTYQPTDIITVDVWGNTVCTEFDQITVTGNLNPNGATLTADFGTTPFVPAPMSTFKIYDAGTLTAGSTFIRGTGMNTFGITYNAGDVILTTLPDIDIAIREVGCSGFEVVVRPNADLPDNTVTNLVFTIQYPTGVSLTNLAPLFGLTQGGAPTVNGFQTITYVATDLPNVDWDANEEIVVLTFNHNQLGTGTGDFTIWPGTFPTQAYYAEYLGSDVTGINYANAIGSWLDGCPVHNFTQNKWYYMIQPAINQANTLSTDRIDVYYKTRNLGLYPEQLVIDRVVDLRGPNYEVNPNGGSRVSEATIALPASPSAYFEGSADGEYPSIFVNPNIDGVSITGFTLDGSSIPGIPPNPNSTTGMSVAVWGSDWADNMMIKNNIVKNYYLPVSSTSYYDENGNWYSTHYVTGTVVENNHIFSTAGRCAGYGIYLQGAVGNVTGNVIENVACGIQIQPYHHTASGNYSIQHNTISAYNIALWFNVNDAESNNSNWVFEDNLLKGAAKETGCTTNTTWEGIGIWSFQGNGTVSVIGNTVDKDLSDATDTYGIYLTGFAGTTLASITNNEIIDAEYSVYLNSGTFTNTNHSFTENSLTGYTGDALTNLSTSTFTATCNWWESASMNDVIAAITGNVVYFPYLISETEVTTPLWTNGFDPLGPCQTPLTFKVFLQGPYVAGGSMTTLLNNDAIGDELPNSQPFNVAPWNYNGTETLPATLPADVVDWVLVELRSTTTTSFGRFAGLLHSDGSVTANITPVLGNSYYFVVYQRNHMPVMSATAVNPYTFAYPYDFTDLANLYGNANTPNTPAFQVETGKWAMIAGDVTHNGLLQYSGSGNDRGPIIAKILALVGGNSISETYNAGGYFFEDVNMNNILKYTGTDNDRAPILSNLGILAGNTYLNAYYVSLVPNYYTGPTKRSSAGPVYIAHDGQNISLGTTQPITSGMVDNVQFTLAWLASDEQAAMAVAGATSDFQLQPQGEPVTINDVTYQVFVSVVPTYLPEMWTEGTRVTALTLGASLPEGRIWVADNGFTIDNNADYYVSVWGSDLTGEIKSGFTGIGDPATGSAMKVYPNPVSGSTLFVELPEAEGQNLTMSVYDLQGRLMMSESMHFAMNRMEIKTSSLPAGMYILKLSNENLLKQTRFVVTD